MDATLEASLSLVETQPDCVHATFGLANNNPLFTHAKDERGQAYLFAPTEHPAVFIELVETLPGHIRGNHMHQHTTETMCVVSGEIEIYLLCEHKKHVFKQTLRAGEMVVTSAGTPHALRSIDESRCVVLFDRDARGDRDRVPILVF